MQKKYIMKTIAIILLSGLLLGCSVTQDRKATALESGLYLYQDAMRWGRWNIVFSSYSKKIAPDTIASLKYVRVTGYTVQQPPILITENKVIQVVEIQYVHKDVQRLYSILDQQEWHYDATKNIWLLHSHFPKFQFKSPK